MTKKHDDNGKAHKVLAAKYVGTECGLIRLNDQPLKPGDVVREPPELVAELLLRSDFQPE